MGGVVFPLTFMIMRHRSLVKEYGKKLTSSLQSCYRHLMDCLKEKRMVVKSLLAKIQNKFHVSAAEVEDSLTYE